MIGRKSWRSSLFWEQQERLIRMAPSVGEESPQQGSLPGGKGVMSTSLDSAEQTLGSANPSCIPANAKREKDLGVFLSLLTK